MEKVNVRRAVVEPNEDFKKKMEKVEKAVGKILNSDGSNMQQKNFSAEEFVENLLNEGATMPCDETSESFNNHLRIPPFYDEELFKKGQDFFHRNIFGLFLSKILSVLALGMALPNSVEILVLTNMSSTPLTAYKRYTSTVRHFCLWYDETFKPGSRSWSSLITVRNLHNSASKKSYEFLKYRISQKDMTLTLLGFMGLGLVRSKFVGVHDATEEELKGFIHLWRTIGYVVGIEDRFNICRASVKETKEICNLLIEKVLGPMSKRPTEEFTKLSKALVSGVWAVNSFIEYNSLMFYLHIVLDNTDDIRSRPHFEDLKFAEKMRVYILFYIMRWCLRVRVIRIILNYLHYLTLWFMDHFPFVAYYQFGKKNLHE